MPKMFLNLISIEKKPYILSAVTPQRQTQKEYDFLNQFALSTLSIERPTSLQWQMKANFVLIARSTARYSMGKVACNHRH